MSTSPTEPHRPGRIETVIDGPVAWLILSNPAKLNAISAAMWGQAVDALDALADDPAIRCVLFAGEGTKAFCSGADIAAKDREAAEGTTPALDPAHAALDRIQAFPKPTIACVSGYCLGAGLALAGACDLRVASQDARFSFPAGRLGLAPGYDVVRRLAQLVGMANAKRILFLADRFSAVEARRLGLVDELVEDGNLQEVAGDLAARIAANAPLTLAAAKCAIEHAFAAAPDDGQWDYAACERACNASTDYAEGRRAFLEKRQPRFEGR